MTIQYFQNGKKIDTVCQIIPPKGNKVPYIELEMIGESPQSIKGKMDTGADITLLSFEDSFNLGIFDPTRGRDPQKIATITGETIDYYEHTLLVRFYVQGIPPFAESLNIVRKFEQSEILPQISFDFYIQVGFAKNLERNLFGINFLEKVNICFDTSSVSFLWLDSNS